MCTEWISMSKFKRLMYQRQLGIRHQATARCNFNFISSWWNFEVVVQTKAATISLSTWSESAMSDAKERMALQSEWRSGVSIRLSSTFYEPYNLSVKNRGYWSLRRIVGIPRKKEECLISKPCPLQYYENAPFKGLDRNGLKYLFHLIPTHECFGQSPLPRLYHWLCRARVKFCIRSRILETKIKKIKRPKQNCTKHS